MDTEVIVKKQLEKRFFTADDIARAIRAALTELSETHAIELRAYEATVQNLAERIRQLEAERMPEGWKLVPIEPSKEMLDSIRAKQWELSGGQFGKSDYMAYYQALLAAVTQPKKEGERVPAQQYTTGHCANKAQPGGCQLHNLHCNYPVCDRRPAATQQQQKEGE